MIKVGGVTILFLGGLQLSLPIHLLMLTHKTPTSYGHLFHL